MDPLNTAELPIAGTVSTGKKERKKRTPRVAVASDEASELGGMTMKYPAKLEAEVRALSTDKGIPLGIIRNAVEGAFYAAFTADGRSVSDIVRDKMFG